MNKLSLSIAGFAGVAGFAAMMALGAPPTATSFSAALEGENEVPLVASAGTGQWQGTLNATGDDIAWTITFSGLSGPPTQSHIHFGQSFVTGGIVYWFCGAGATPGPVGTAACPAANNGTLSGHITAAGIQAATTQGISAGDFAKILAALRDGNAYVNIHSIQSPGGEIRGQVQVTKGHGNGNGNGNGKGKGNGNGNDD